jgi:hypothetical protein
MRIFTNEKLFKRNTRLAFIANLGAMFFLLVSVYVLFSGQALGLYLLFLIAGIVCMQTGLYFGRWNRRPDLALNVALKSVDDSYSLYHYTTPVSHLLLGPSGLWILLPRHARGTITFDQRRQKWKLKTKGILSRFGQEPIGRPIGEASLEAEALDRFLEKHWKKEDGDLRVQAALVFVSASTEVEGAGNAPIPTVNLKKAKQMLLKADEKSHLTKVQVKKLNDLFEGK